MKLSIENIKKNFGSKEVLKGISLEARSGSALGILGRNGAGKTTTIRIIMNVFGADEGRVLIDNQEIDRSQLRIGYMPEERGLFAKRVILEQLVYLGSLKGLSTADAKKSALYWLERLEMSEYASKKLDTLSKGNQQKIQLVATLISDPDIVILDEPFSGLDPVNAMLLKDVVKELIADNKVVLFSSHQMNYIEEFCNNIVILNGGNIVLSGNIHEIKKSYDRSKIVIRSNHIDQIKDNLTQKCEIQDEEHILVQLDDASEKDALLKQLLELGIDFDEFKVFEPSLNDIFVEYTEEGI